MITMVNAPLGEHCGIFLPGIQRHSEESAKHVVVGHDAALANDETGAGLVPGSRLDTADACDDLRKQRFVARDLGPIVWTLRNASVLGENSRTRDEQDKEIKRRSFVFGQLDPLALFCEAL